MEKENIVMRLGLGRDATVSYIHQQYDTVLHNYTVGLCRRYHIPIVQAEDLMQEFYLSVLKNHHAMIKGYLVRGIRFFYRVIKNDVFDFNRKKKSRNRLEEIYTMGVNLDFDLFYLAADLFQVQFTDELSRLLSKPDYAVFKLYLQGYSYREIEQKLCLNQNTIGVKIFRSKKVLRKFYLP